MSNSKNFYKYKPTKSKSIPIKQVAIVLVFLFIALFVYFSFFKAEETILAGFNWSDGVIKIETEEGVIEVQPSEMYNLRLQRRGDLLVSIKDEKNNVIRENRFRIGIKKSVILELVSSNQNQCIVEADVSSIYYDTGAEARVTEYSKINDGKPANSFFFDTEKDFKFYVYPGRYAKELLPELLPKEQKVFGVFFVDCENLDKIESLNSDILGSIFYEVE